MRRWLILPVLLIAALALSAAGFSKAPKPSKPSPKNGKATSVTVVRTDNGSCDNAWATDTVKSDFKVKRNDDGSFRFTRRDHGTFVTMAGKSPGACNKGSDNGHTIRAGVTGKVHGYIVGTVTGGTFNPNGCAANPAACSTRSGTVDALFGPGASANYSCNQDSKDCKFDYEYSAPAQNLGQHHWSDKGKGAGSMLKERFHGDISDQKK
jgi:hypothetical protein